MYVGNMPLIDKPATQSKTDNMAQGHKYFELKHVPKAGLVLVAETSRLAYSGLLAATRALCDSPVPDIPVFCSPEGATLRSPVVGRSTWL